MPSLLVCALLGLAAVVLLDVLAAPAPRPRPVPSQVVLVGLARLRRSIATLPRPAHRPRGTPTTFAWDLADTVGEIEVKPTREGVPPEGPSVIVED